jgi:hypothetical protein
MAINKKFVAPALPLPREVYDRQQMDELVRALRLYFNLLDGYLSSVVIPPSGPTADRPTTNLFVGDYYFDTTLNLPIWYDGTDWIDAAGNVV